MKKTVFLIAALCAGLSVLTAQEVRLSFNPAKGAVYTYNYEIKQTLKQKVMEMDVQTLQNISMVYTMTVLNKNKENVKVAFEYKDIFYELINPMMSIRYDSNNPVENPTKQEEMITKIYDCLVGLKFEAMIALNGKVELLTDMNKTISEMLALLNFEEGLLNGMEEMLRKQMGNEALEREFERSLNVYPEGKVKVGDKWTVDHTFEVMDIKLHIANQYELTQIDKKEVVLSVGSLINGSGDNGLRGTQTGVSHLDRKTGMLKKATIHQDVKGDISLYEMTIPMEILSTINITIQKK